MQLVGYGVHHQEGRPGLLELIGKHFVPHGHNRTRRLPFRVVDPVANSEEKVNSGGRMKNF